MNDREMSCNSGGQFMDRGRMNQNGVVQPLLTGKYDFEFTGVDVSIAPCCSNIYRYAYQFRNSFQNSTTWKNLFFTLIHTQFNLADKYQARQFPGLVLAGKIKQYMLIVNYDLKENIMMGKPQLMCVHKK